MRRLAPFLLATLVALGAGISPQEQAALDRIRADSLRGHVSFLASDLLEGRATPSRGLDIAADYIAAQFRRAGLEPAGDDGYFQTSEWSAAEADPAGFSLSVVSGGRRLTVAPSQISLPLHGPLQLEAAGLFRADLDRPEDLERLAAADLAGKVAAVTLSESSDRRALGRILVQLRRLGPTAILVAAASGAPAQPAPSLREPGAPLRVSGPPQLTAYDPSLHALLASLPAGLTGATASLTLSAPLTRLVRLRNVAALLRGSDPALRDTYVILSAHYDHTGIGPERDGDPIYNGANDNASGTASVIEAAAALADLSPAPRRSILFLAFFGEEIGLLGSRYYTRHPIVPLSATVAALCLEHMGRTDSEQGPRLLSANLTGFTYSDLPSTVVGAGALLGVRVWADPSGDSYFARSDNLAFADAGIPSHTLSVTYEFSDYHLPGDHWDKIDYANMQAVVRTVALAVVQLANSEQAPQWDDTVPRTERYRKAREGATAP